MQLLGKMKNKRVSVEEIESMSYPDFVGYINQWNVLPGAYSTLSKWKVFSNLNESSNLLEIGCTTGFSSRELALMSNCRGKAFDISRNSVEAAIRNKEKYAPEIKIDYEVKDAYKYKSSQKFSHIVIGAALKFFPDPEKLIDKIVSLLTDGGVLLASPFYIKKPLPSNLIAEFEKVFGIRPTTEGYKDVMKLYRGFEILYEDRNDLIKETEEELEHYCSSTIERVCKEKNILDEDVRDAMYNRLLEIKRMSNRLRDYQGYCVLVLRYRKDIYPKRYVELF